MLADLPDYAQWTGAAPYTELRKASEKLAAATKDRMATVHYWGQFTDRLPAPFTADGGHQYITCATEDEALAKLGELSRAVKAKFPNVEISEDDEQTHFLLTEGDDEAEMWAELSPKSEYDASWQAHSEDESWVHEFGKKARALFWDIGGPGVADVGVSADGDEIVLMRSWVDEEEDEAKARSLVDAPTETEESGGEITIPSGKAIVIWSPVAPFQLEGLSGPDDLAKLGDDGKAPELDTELIGGVGTVIKVKPGRWVVTLGSTDDDDDDLGDEEADEDIDDEDMDDEDDANEDEASWSCRWCRLKWVGEA